ncbi:MAG: nascent polypeptide-associated complex protein [Candidatus Bathyarchaeia archaeon]
MKRLSSREAKRMMSRIGIDAKELPEVREVIFKTDTKEMVVRNPTVTVIDFQGQKMFQVIGEGLIERITAPTQVTVETKPKTPDEDIQLVATQANVSLNEAKEALEKTGGDLAQAILLLTSKRR